jgi:hypothetical protein
MVTSAALATTNLFQHGGSPDRLASRAMAWDRNRSNMHEEAKTKYRMRATAVFQPSRTDQLLVGG